MAPGSQVADKRLVQHLTEIRRVVVCVGDNHSDTNIAAQGRVSAVSCPDNEVVALHELIVEHASREYQSPVAVDLEVVSAVVDVR